MKSEVRYSTVIFDLDGTLLDTLSDLTDAVNHALSRYGYPERTPEEVRRFVGNGVKRLMILALPWGEENPDFNMVFDAFRTYYAAHCCDKTRPYDGIPELLRSIRRTGRRIAVVSNKSDAAVRALCKQYFPDTVSVAIGENEAAGIRKKPAPDTVYEALQRIGSSGDDAVYVGDSEVDVETACNARLPCLSVTWGFRSEEWLIEHGAAKLISKPADLMLAL